MTFNPQNVREFPLQGNPGDVVKASHAAATITYAGAGAGVSHGVNAVTVGFSATPTAPVDFTIADGSSVIFSAPVTAAGSETFHFGCGKLNTPGNAMTLTLPDGGSGVVGTVSVGEHFLLGNQTLFLGMDFEAPANSFYLGVI